MNLTHTVCALTTLLDGHSLVSPLLLAPPIPCNTTALKLSQLITRQHWPFKCSVEERVTCACQKLEMIKFSAESILKAKTGQKVGLLCQTGSQVVNVKEKFLNEVKSAIVKSTQMIRK